jgi:hypothetical protein
MKEGTEISGLAFDDPKTRICDDFASALHAMAQPLTVLRGALGALKLRGTSTSEADRYIDLSNVQVERVCSLMSSMHDLLDQHQFDAVCVPTCLRDLMVSIIENEVPSLQRAGLRVSFTEVDREIQVLADSARTEQAMHAVLNAIATASSRDDEIDLKVDLHDGFADVVVEARYGDEGKLATVERLCLSIAETAVKSQNGHFAYLANPLRISLKLPLCDHNGQHAHAANLFHSAEQVHLRASCGSMVDESKTQK